MGIPTGHSIRLAAAAAALLFVIDGPSAYTGLSYHPVVGAVTSSQAAVYARTESSAQVEVVYSRYPDFSASLVAPDTAAVTTVAQDDYVAHILLTDLMPQTRYYYKVVVDGTPSGIYHFTTFPLDDAVRDFAFALFADSDVNGRTAVHQTAGLDNPAFILQGGDYSHSTPGDIAGAPISGWWTNNRNALRDSWYGPHYTLKTSIPFVHIWDDHDYGTDNGTKKAWFKAIATQAFLDYFPTYTLPNPAAGLWQKFKYGQAEFFILDLRSQKDPYSEADNSAKSMMNGDEIANDQKTWLKQSLLKSSARWKFVASSLSWNPTVPKKEAWHTFRTEQNELVNFIRNNGITGVVFVSGDIHSGGGIDDGSNAFFPEVSVPNTNKGPTPCTSGPCGTWSEGIIDPRRTAGGYVLVKVRSQGPVEFHVKDFYGTTNKLTTLDAAGGMITVDYPDRTQYSLTIVSPSTNIAWALGEVRPIKWTHDIGRAMDTFSKVELSRNNGGSWETLAPAVLNTASGGRFDWTATGQPTASALIRVSTLDGDLSDVTDTPFRIEANYVTVTAPNTAGIWDVGTLRRIKWAHNLGSSSYARVSLSRNNGSTWGVIADSVRNGSTSGQFDWTVTGPATTAAVIKVEILNRALQDRSDVAFTIR